MIYVTIVSKSKLTGIWMTETKEFPTKEKALRFMYAMRNKGIIIDDYRCDDYIEHEWLNKRFRL